MQDINKVVDGLIEEKGLGQIDDDKKALLRESLAEQLTERINEAIVYRMSEGKFKEYQDVVTAEKLDEERLEKVVKGSGLNLKEITEGVIERFRKTFLEFDFSELNGKAVA